MDEETKGRAMTAAMSHLQPWLKEARRLGLTPTEAAGILQGQAFDMMKRTHGHDYAVQWAYEMARSADQLEHGADVSH